MRRALLLALLAAACRNGTPSPAAAPAPAADVVSGERLLDDLARLAADSMRGRRAGSEENRKARDFVAARFAQLGVEQARGGGIEGWVQPFTFTPRGGGAPIQGGNVVGVVRGSEHPDRYLVVTAHFDHVGVNQARAVNGDSIFNGADDNASGTAALLAVAEALVRERPRHSVLLVAFDAEEMGLRGARAFVENPPVPLASMVLNLNMDMVSHSERGELYVAGTAHTPRLRALVERVAARAPVSLRLGHDTPTPSPQDDWTMQSDQGAFHEKGIPFLYFGVEDHPDYHRPSDEVDSITPEFFVDAVRTVLMVVREVDRG